MEQCTELTEYLSVVLMSASVSLITYAALFSYLIKRDERLRRWRRRD